MAWQNDPILQPLIASARGDPQVEGLILSGSRGAGVHDQESDYDLEWVLSDAAYDQRLARGEKLHMRAGVGDPPLDVSYTCLRELRQLAVEGTWELPGYATAYLLYDKSGQVAQALQALVVMPAERARADVLGWFDAYLNAFYRSLKAWRRNNELGARLHAAEAAQHLVRVLFALERRWPPYHDRLAARLDSLAGQGWPPGYLHATLLELVRSGSPRLQQELEARVEVLLRERGFEPDLWGGEIERIKRWQFDF